MTSLVRTLILFCCFFTSLAKAEDVAYSTFEEAFQAGVANYQSEKFPEAIAAFDRALQITPDQVQALINLSLAQYKAGNRVLAYALMRRASSLAPQLTLPKSGIEFYLGDMKLPDVPREITGWQEFRKQLLAPFSINTYLAFLALSLLAFGLTLIRYFSKRQNALRANTVFPGFGVTQTLIILLFPTLAVLSVLKFYDASINRAIVAVEKLQVQSAPDNGSPSLLELYGGLEVDVRQMKEDWVQITYPGTSTGWVQKSQLVFLSRN